MSAIAERAGVQRHTYFRYFPDERSLGLACSGLYAERNPLPDPSTWREIEDSEKRLRHGLGELYAYYEGNEPMLTNITRDAEVDPLTAELAQLRFGPDRDAIRAALASGHRSKRALAVLDVALAFSTWRTLVRDSGLDRREAIEAMVADYVDEIRAVQPAGPYHLMGYSLGGNLAHAVATELQRDGADIGLLAMFDCYPQEWRPPDGPERDRQPGNEPARADLGERPMVGAVAQLADEAGNAPRLRPPRSCRGRPSPSPCPAPLRHRGVPTFAGR